MNAVDKKPNYKKMYKEVCKIFNKKKKHFGSGPFDETFFTLRVFETAKQLIKLITKPVNEQEVLTATLFHDIGKIKLNTKKLFKVNGWVKNFREEWYKHPKISGVMARPILEKFGHSKEFIDNVIYLISNHDKRTMKNKSLELKIVQDADYIGDTGFAGFIRPFTFSGKFFRSIIEQILYMKNTSNSRLNLEKINLKISKDLIKKNTILENELKEVMIKLIDSELLK